MTKTLTDAIQTITKIQARKWFDSHYGNTYHNVIVTGRDAAGELVSEQTGKVYGYGYHWRQTLESFAAVPYNGTEACLRADGIELSVVDVKSERGLYTKGRKG